MRNSAPDICVYDKEERDVCRFISGAFNPLCHKALKGIHEIQNADFFPLGQKKTPKPLFFKLRSSVEHSGFEPLTPTLPVWCATSCANAPRTKGNIAQFQRFVKHFLKNECFPTQFFFFAPIYILFPTSCSISLDFCGLFSTAHISLLSFPVGVHSRLSGPAAHSDFSKDSTVPSDAVLICAV